MRLHFALLVSCAWCVSCASRAPDVPVLVAPIPKPQPHPDKPVIVRAAEPVAAPEPSVVPSCASAPRDPRVKDPRRAVALVAAEHAALTRLYDATRDGSPDKALVALRLADVEIELSRAEPSRESLSGDAAVHYEVARREGKGASYEASTYRLALDAECRGDTATARKLAFEIVSRAPSSVWVPHAYLLFGELFLAEGAKDPTKLELARMAYLEAAKRRGDAGITALVTERLRALPTKPEPEPDEP